MARFSANPAPRTNGVVRSGRSGVALPRPRLGGRAGSIQANYYTDVRRGIGVSYRSPLYNPYAYNCYGGNRWTLGFSFGHGFRWGMWSYPFSSCAWLPTTYWYDWDYGWSWRHATAFNTVYSYNYRYSFWPGRTCYIPVVWHGGFADEEAEWDTGSSVSVSTTTAPPEAEATPESLAARFISLGDYYFKEGRFGDAADAYARARTYAPDDASVHLVMADALFATGDYHFAAFLVGEGVRLDPAIVTATADKRDFYGDPKLFEKQMKDLAKYLADKPYDAAAHFMLGYNLFFSTRVEQSRQAFERVLEVEPSHAGAKVFLAEVDRRKAEAAKPAEIR